MLAGGGAVDGTPVVPAGRIGAAIEPQGGDIDAIYGVRTRRGLGYRLGAGPLASAQAFGYVGGGGSFAHADPARRLAIGFAKNHFTYRTPIAMRGRPRERSAGERVARATVESVGIPG